MIVHYFNWGGPDETTCGFSLTYFNNIKWSTVWRFVTCKRCLRAQKNAHKKNRHTK